MVVFTCNHCGDSLHKPKVEKHYSFVCRTEKSLTCVDCFKDFRGEEYVVHTKCLTEDERYSAKGTYANGMVMKGEVKQESWVEMIKSILDKEINLKPSCRNLLNTISNYSNIPRKKPKFINFIKSSSGGRINMKDVEEVWNIIEKYKNETTKNGQTTNDNNQKVKENQNGDGISEEKDLKDERNEIKKRKTNEESEDTPKKKKHKKNQQIEEAAVENENVTVENNQKKNKVKKDKEETVETTDETGKENTKFNFKEKILEIVAAKGGISLKKLQKKVLNAYLKETGESEVTPKAIKKFNKKLKKIPNLEVSDDKVTILENN